MKKWIWIIIAVLVVVGGVGYIKISASISGINRKSDV